MKIEQVLDEGRNSVAGCTVAAFGDTSAHLILRASFREGIRREYLDTLCNHAISSFEAIDTSWTTPGPKDVAPASLNEAVVLTKRETMVFVRSDASQSEFLCLVSDDPGCASELSIAAHRTMQSISAAS